MLARLKDGLSLQQAQARADVFSDGLAQKFPESNEGWKVELMPVEKDAAGSFQPAMFVLLAAVGCVLFIACSNVASLFLVQFTSRSQELSMRYALGASRMRVLRQLLTESMLLSITGGLLGFGVATWMVHYFRSVMPEPRGIFQGLVQLDGIEVDSTLVLFATLITMLAGILVVLIPVSRSSQLHLESSLRNAGRTALGNRWGTRGHDALVMAEVAVAVVLVVASGILVRSISEMCRQELGFDPENVAFLEVRRADWKIRQEHTGEDGVERGVLRSPERMDEGDKRKNPISYHLATWGHIDHLWGRAAAYEGTVSSLSVHGDRWAKRRTVRGGTGRFGLRRRRLLRDPANPTAARAHV